MYAKVVSQIIDWYHFGGEYKRIKVKSKWQITSVQRLIQIPRLAVGGSRPVTWGNGFISMA
jgi:hypothetical protein